MLLLSVKVDVRLTSSQSIKFRVNQKKFDDYFSVELKKINLGKKKDKDGNVEKDENGKDKQKEATLSDYGVKFALGVKGPL